MNVQYGLFSDESQDWTQAEAVEAGFYSRNEAEEAIRDRYSDEDELVIHEIEEPEEEEEEEEEEEDEEDEVIELDCGDFQTRDGIVSRYDYEVKNPRK